MAAVNVVHIGESVLALAPYIVVVGQEWVKRKSKETKNSLHTINRTRPRRQRWWNTFSSRRKIWQVDWWSACAGRSPSPNAARPSSGGSLARPTAAIRCHCVDANDGRPATVYNRHRRNDPSSPAGCPCPAWENRSAWCTTHHYHSYWLLPPCSHFDRVWFRQRLNQLWPDYIQLPAQRSACLR